MPFKDTQSRRNRDGIVFFVILIFYKRFFKNKTTPKMGDILSGEFQKTLLSASIAFDQSNGLSPLYQTERENKLVFSQNILSFLLVLV